MHHYPFRRGLRIVYTNLQHLIVVLHSFVNTAECWTFDGRRPVIHVLPGESGDYSTRLGLDHKEFASGWLLQYS